MQDKVDLNQLASQIDPAAEEHIGQKKLPPVEKWNPPFCGDLDMHIHRDGRWFYLGSEIKRQALVNLFSTILLREGDDYFLLTPVEKYRIRVDDVPFLAVEVRQVEGEQGPALQFRTTTDDWAVAGAEHPLRVEIDPVTQEPSPYILLRKNLEALIARSVFYELVEMADTGAEDSTELFIDSNGVRFSLGRFG